MEPLIESQEQTHVIEKTIFGFWVYLMSDCLLFASLFATFVVLRGNTYGGPTGAELFSLPFVLTETFILLTSSFTCGLAILAMYRNHAGRVLSSLIATLVLGASFVALEMNEFSHLVQSGASWQRSGFLSAYFTLVGTHGAHVSAGLVWMLLLIMQIYMRGLTPATKRRLICLSLFWHFLDIIWVFIFSIVYLIGVL